MSCLNCRDENDGFFPLPSLFLIVVGWFLSNVDISVGPSSLRLLGVEQSLSAGQPHEVRCEAVGARPPPLISWWRSGEKIVQGVSRPQVKFETGSWH